MGKRGRKRDYGRKEPRILPRRTVYVICEGTKTEYLYLKAIKRQRRLRTVTVDIDPGSRSGSDPKSLMEYAKAKKVSEDYDDAWCVFDGDERPYVEQVLTDAKGEPKVDVAFSNPCFELWYFLHYEYSTGACTQEQMVERLKRHIPDYVKSKDVFADLPDRSIATKRASELRRHHSDSGNQETENPSTGADLLVELLYTLEDRR